MSLHLAKNTESKTASSPTKKHGEKDSKQLWAWRARQPVAMSLQLKNTESKTASSYEPAFG